MEENNNISSNDFKYRVDEVNKFLRENPLFELPPLYLKECIEIFIEKKTEAINSKKIGKKIQKKYMSWLSYIYWKKTEFLLNNYHLVKDSFI